VICSARRLLGIAPVAFAFGALAILAAPLSAQADVVNVNECDGSALSQPFAPWADYSSYELAPGGDFESSPTGWSLRHGAGVASGSDSFAVTGSVGSSSLSLPPGAGATSPPTCVNAAYPTFRLFTRADNPGTTVSISVVYGTGLGIVKIPVGVVAPGSDWEPTPPMLTASAIASALDGGSANLSLRFTAHGGTAQIDDVYVDPHSRCC
jgi:hypothetical protein